MEQGAAFDVAPVGTEVLAAAVGTGRVPFTRSVRGMADVDTIVFRQQFGQTGRIAIDTWWAQTGAALVANNVLAMRN